MNTLKPEAGKVAIAPRKSGRDIVIVTNSVSTSSEPALRGSVNVKLTDSNVKQS